MYWIPKEKLDVDLHKIGGLVLDYFIRTSQKENAPYFWGVFLHFVLHCFVLIFIFIQPTFLNFFIHNPRQSLPFSYIFVPFWFIMERFFVSLKWLDISWHISFRRFSPDLLLSLPDFSVQFISFSLKLFLLLSCLDDVISLRSLLLPLRRCHGDHQDFIPGVIKHEVCYW